MLKPILLGVALASAALCAQAAVTVSAGQLSGSFITLSSSNVSGGALYAQNVNHGNQVAGGVPGTPVTTDNYAAQPWDGLAGVQTVVGSWFAAGPSNINNGGDPENATLTLGTGITAVSFLWGSPDSYNAFTVNDVGGAHVFGSFSDPWYGASISSLQDAAYYITFTSDSTISSIVFSSPGANAIEIANVAVVPEPEAYGLALAGLGVVGFAMRRRRKS